jgi:hypothetical protein
MTWCCYIFESLATAAGEAGLAIIVVTIADQDSFVLQGRAVDAGTQMPDVPIKITTMTQQAIFHCPGCGVRLDTYYKRSIEQLRREDLNHR